jgi:hypothetical protein
VPRQYRVVEEGHDNQSLEAALKASPLKAKLRRKVALYPEVTPQHRAKEPSGKPTKPVVISEYQRQSSTKTFVEDTRISNYLNNVALQMSARRPLDAKRELSRVLRNSDIQAMRLKERMATISADQARRSRPRSKPKAKLDSIFSAEEAGLVLDELLYTQTLAEDWRSVVNEMRENPKVLMNLIPIELPKPPKLQSPRSHMSRTMTSCYSPPSARTPLKSPLYRVNLAKTQVKQARLPVISGGDRRSRSTSPSFKSKKPSLSDSQVQTLLNEADESLTDDWNNSLLNFNLKKGLEKFNSDNDLTFLSVEEMSRISGAPPRDSQARKDLYKKCLRTLEELLVEMLGTKEDVLRFRDRYSKPTARSTMAILSKCLELVGLRHKTLELLKEIHKREDLIKTLPSAGKKSKEVLMEIYRLSRLINQKVKSWEESNVPFDKFVFKGKHYPEKMASEQAYLVKCLAKELDFNV